MSGFDELLWGSKDCSHIENCRGKAYAAIGCRFEKAEGFPVLFYFIFIFFGGHVSSLFCEIDRARLVFSRGRRTLGKIQHSCGILFSPFSFSLFAVNSIPFSSQLIYLLKAPCSIDSCQRRSPCSQPRTERWAHPRTGQRETGKKCF